MTAAPVLVPRFGAWASNPEVNAIEFRRVK